MRYVHFSDPSQLRVYQPFPQGGVLAPPNLEGDRAQAIQMSLEDSVSRDHPHLCRLRTPDNRANEQSPPFDGNHPARVGEDNTDQFHQILGART